MGRPIMNTKYLSGGLNGDSTLVGLLPEQFINGQNIRFGSSDRGGDDQVQSIGGTTKLVTGSFNNITVYDEDTEWTPSASFGVTADFNNTQNPYHLVKAAKVSFIPFTSSYIEFVNPGGAFNLSPYLYLNFYLSLIDPLTTGNYFAQFYNGSNPVGNQVTFLSQNDSNNVALPSNGYQQINMALAEFGITQPVDRIRIRFNGSNANLYIDYIRLFADPIYTLGNKENNIGSCEDEAGQRVMFFNCDKDGNSAVFCWDKKISRMFTMMTDMDVVGGLNFSRESYIHSSFFINNCLYWVDGTNNQPRRFDTEAAIKAHYADYVTDVAPYTLPVSQSVIAWIRRQPGLPPSQLKQTLGSPYPANNFIKYAALQFCYRYQYRNFEYSTLSALSDTANYNTELQTFNNVDIEIPGAEFIDQDVLQVDLVVRILASGIDGNEDDYFVIKSWNINNPTEAAQINVHNTFGTPLSFVFYNDTTGIALSNSYKVKPFDSVPLFAQTAERAKNRTYMGNVILGYDTPKKTSLSFSETTTHIDISSFVPTGAWYLFNFEAEGFGGVIVPASKYIMLTSFAIHNTDKPGATFYYQYVPSGVPPFPSSGNPADFTFLGNTLYDVMRFYYPLAVTVNFKSLTFQSAYTVVNGTSAPVNPYFGQVFKTNASYQLAVTFYDNYGRKCGVLTNDSLIASIPDTGMISGNYVTALNWFLSNANAYNEIPPWACYYSVDVTKCLRTRFFLQGAGNAIYATVDSSGVYSFTTSAYSPGLAGIGIDISGLSSFNMGYTYSAGDIIKVIYNGNQYTLSIIAQVGKYVVCELQNMGTLSFATVLGTITGTFVGALTGVVSVNGSGEDGFFSGALISGGPTAGGTVSGILETQANFTPQTSLSGILTDTKGTQGDFTGFVQSFHNAQVIFEIYTPYKKSTNEPYYEQGKIYQVLNPGTPLRAYNVTADSIVGDTSLLLRTIKNSVLFVAETMSPNDKFWMNWNTNAGRPNFIDTIGQTIQLDAIPFSNVVIDGTKTNGLSTYDALNITNVPRENGAIQKLQLAQKIEEKGAIMLAICERETCSLYLGEVQVVSNTGSSFIASSDGVIGTINPLKGSFGTRHPESVFEYNGLVFWYDMLNGAFIQYANNGLDPISRFGMKLNTELFSLALQSLTNIQIEQLGSRPFVIGGVDPYHKEALWTIPATTQTPAKGFLPDYGSPYVPYPYQLYDGSSGTWAFKFERNQWMGNRTFAADGLRRSGNDLFGWKDGVMYKFNDPTLTNQNTFFGVYKTSRIAYVENSNPKDVKSFENANVKGNMAPVWAHFMTLYPWIQATDLVQTADQKDWAFKEGVWYATLLRDRLSPNISGTFDERVITGDKMRAQYLLCLLEFDVTQEQLFINFVATGYLESVGHNK